MNEKHTKVIFIMFLVDNLHLQITIKVDHK